MDHDLSCMHGKSSNAWCRECGDVVPTLHGKRPWWATLERWRHRSLVTYNVFWFLFGLGLYWLFKTFI